MKTIEVGKVSNAVAGFCMTFLLIPQLPVAQPASTIEKSGQVTTQTTVQQWINASGAAWVWPAQFGDEPNQYVQIMHDFELPADTPATAQLAVSADTNYAVWLNGRFVDTGQWSDYPDDKTYDLLDLGASARDGANRLCILTWYQGQSSSQYLKGAPGVFYALHAAGRIHAVSGEASRVRRAPDYVSGPVPRVTGQLSFTFEYHADKSDGWLEPGYALDDSWLKPAAPDLKPLSSRPVRPRPVAKLTLGNRLPMRLTAQGAFSRSSDSKNVAVAMQSDALAFRPADALYANPRAALSDSQTTGLQLKPEAWKGSTGAYIVLDTGREEAGLLELDLDAPAGTVVDIAYGEHLEDLRVRAHIGGRNFANRYVCAAGRRTFLHPFLRFAGRYIQLHITPAAASVEQPIILQYAGLRPTDYPVSAVGNFRCPDSFHNKIYEVSARTLHLCMHEHYEDCPWREQALYGMDSRNQALAGYYCFGNYDFARASIDLLGKGLKPDGFLEMCAPAEIRITIPSFSLAWILMLDDYMLFSGDREFSRSQLPIAKRILETCSGLTSGPVIATPRGERMWNFYEWAPGLDGGGFAVLETERYEAPLNLFYLLALDAAARIARECNEDPKPFNTKAEELRRAFAAAFWDAKERAFATRVDSITSGSQLNHSGGRPHFAELTQALAILAGVVPPDELGPLRDRLARDANGLVPCTISHTLYKFEALLTDSERFAPRVFQLIRRDWSYMLLQGATSFWETIDGAAAFGNAGSLCHGWSGIPAWFYGAYILGVKPATPGFEEYKMEPVRGVFTSAEGTVPTPSGVLKATWRSENNRIIKEITPHAFSRQE